MRGLRDFRPLNEAARRAALVLLLASCTVAAAAKLDRASSAREPLLSDLPEEVWQTLEQRDELAPGAPQLLQAVFEASKPRSFDAGGLRVRADPRWLSSQAPESPGSPWLVLRRWPGDTLLALYSLQGPIGADAPAIVSAKLKREGSGAEWRGSVATPAGERPMLWIERDLKEGSPCHLGALLLPGDAGWGSAGLEPLTQELRAVLERIELANEAEWGAQSCQRSGVTLLLPETEDTPGDKDESLHSWGVLHGQGFTLGLPPGVRAHRLDGDFPGTPIPGGLAWLRGRFTDSEGTRVAIGDARRAGYVAERHPVAAAATSPPQPLGSPDATLLASDLFETAAEQTGARAVRAQRWREQGFPGAWLVFQLEFEDRMLEIGLPVLEGRRSPTLFWIPATWRPRGRSPAPPPVDPSLRFGIRYERLRSLNRDAQPWIQGFLTAPGLKLALPAGWHPAATLRSTAGFPVQLVDQRRVRHGSLWRLEAKELAALEDDGDWKLLDRPASRGAARAYGRADGACLLVAREGHAFLLEPAAGSGETWKLVAASLQLTPAVKQRRKSEGE